MRRDIHVLPETFLERLRHLLPPRQYEAVAKSFAESKPTTFRVNTLKVRPNVIREELTGQGFRLEPVSWYPDAFLLQQGRLRLLQETDAYRSGAIYVQSLPSMVPPLVLDPQPGEQVLDLTAAPGSKTTQLACLMRGEGKIVACEKNRVRFFKLRANVLLQAAHNVELMLQDGKALGRTYPEQFDRVLLDAPCSAEGRFRVHEPASYRYWKPRKIHEMVHQQKPLLYSAITALRPGGALVYSTCTFAPEENEGVVDWALGKFEHAIHLEAIPLRIPNVMPGLTAWEAKLFAPSLRRAVRILPNDAMEGFFLAKFRKRTYHDASARRES